MLIFRSNLILNLHCFASGDIQVYVLLTLAAFGFVGNVLIIVILLTKRVIRKCFTPINFLILQLAVSDLLVVAFCLFAGKYTGLWPLAYGLKQAVFRSGALSQPKALLMCVTLENVESDKIIFQAAYLFAHVTHSRQSLVEDLLSEKF